MKKSRAKRSKIWTTDINELQRIFNNSSSLKEVIKALKMNVSCGNYKTLNIRISEESIDLKIFNINKGLEIKSRGKRSEISNEEVFVENSEFVDRKSIKKRLLSIGRKYECERCKISEYNSEYISLQLDHINGINTDNRVENLRFLCPNCHSQTETFSGKSLKGTGIIYLCSCGSKKQKESLSCLKCSKKATKIKWPDPQEFQKELWLIPTAQISIKLGVSDKAIEKFCKKHNLTKPPRGFWQKRDV